MAGRFHKLTRELIKQEIQTLVAEEEQLGDDRLKSKNVAVFPLSYQGVDEKYSALGRGLSEMLTVDLGKVSELNLLERLRLQTLLDELALAQTEFIDPESAPRVGKILGAGRIVAGSVNVMEEDRLQVDLFSWDIVNRNFPEAVTESDELDNLFRMEKQLVFGIIDEMGVEITPEEREDIQRIPTQNLQAFLAYCRGLEQEAAGNPAAAARFFQQAAQIDPNFQEAAIHAEAAEGLSTAGGSPDQVLGKLAAIETEATGPSTSQEDLVNSRLRNLGNSIGSNFVPGQDSRKSSEEAQNSGADFGELQEPPLPPAPQNPNRPPR